MSIITYKDKEYIEHAVFNKLKEFQSFYDSLSDGVMRFLPKGTRGIINIDTYVYMSMAGTLESIFDVLIKGKINDAYALLRKLYDLSIINIYANLYIEDNYGLDNLEIESVNNWIVGKGSFTRFSDMIKYIEASKKLQDITILLRKDDRYIKIRDRCSNHMHYNSYKHVLRNAGEVYLPKTQEVLNTFLSDVESIFIQHMAYIFYLKDYYMSSSDYVDYLDCGAEPPQDCQYWVAPFIQEIFDNIINNKRPDIAQTIKSSTNMHLK